MADVHNFTEPYSINYRVLAKGLDFYEAHGYHYLEVPWVVSQEATNTTKPADKVANSIKYGDLVGSGEQGFIELLLRGHIITKACTITPCFRNESEFDKLHHAYFMKLELINTDATIDNLRLMVSDGLHFFSKYLDVKVVETGKDMYDIVDTQNDIELGSYGFRSVNGISFIYGTGVALPRLDTAIAQHS